MWDRIRIGRSLAARSGDGAGARAGRRSARRPLVESLEGRQLMATGASLAPIANVTVPAQQGYTQYLDGSGTTDDQTFTVTSSNPDIGASIVSGPFWTVDISYTDSTTPSNSFSGPLVFQLFNNAGSTTLTPNTVSRIETFTNAGFYTDTGKYITRVQNGFPGASDFVVQGGAPNPDGTGSSGTPPIANENVQQLAFTGNYQLAMANANTATNPDTNDSQFFITSLADPATSNPNNSLGYGFTIFGQMVPNPTTSSTGTSVPSDLTTLSKLTQIPTSTNPSTGLSQPNINPLITSATVSNTNPSGTLLIDTSQAKQGETSTITVTATDSVTGQQTSQTFTVTVGAYGGPASPPINFRPFANASSVTATQGQSTNITLTGTSGFPTATTPSTLSYSLVSQPTHGTVSNFNPSTGTLTYTPNPGYTGTDSLQFQVNATGPQATPATTTSNPATVSISISPTTPVNTGAVRVVGPVALVTPLPRRNPHAKNTIDVVQTTPSGSATPVIEVFVNGQLDINQPSIDSIDSIIVFGSRANDRITIDPSVTIPTLLNGGNGGRNVLIGGGGETREHGWFGHNRLVGGAGPNQLIGRAGLVKFKPSSGTDLIFAGTPGSPPRGTFFVFKKGRLIPVPESRLFPKTTGHTR